MSAVLNDRDAILQAAATRIVNPKNADILLQQSAPGFHVNAAGAADVASITVSATLVGLEGAVSWSVQGATLTNVTDREVTVTYANMQGSTAIVSASIMSSGEPFARSVVLATIQDGAPGSSAKTVKLTPSEQVFKISKAGANSPASITLTATGQNTAGTPSFTIPVGTATLTAGSSSAQKVLTFANMATDQVTIEVTLDGQKDRVTIYKVREGQDGQPGQPGIDAIVGLLTNESVTLPAGSNGVVSSFSSAVCTMVMYKGAADDSANWTYAFSPASASNRLSYTTSGSTVTLTGMAAGVDSSYVDITASKAGAAPVTKRFFVTKSKAGASVTGARGAGTYYVVGSTWSDVAAQAACPGGPVVNDQVTISNGTVTYTKRWDGAAWNVPGAYLSDELFVEKGIRASKVDTNGLVVRDLLGNPILGIGVPLDPAYAAPGTRNAEAIFATIQQWDFRNTLEGFTVANGTLTQNADSVMLASNGDVMLRSPTIAIDGSRYDKVRVKIKRLAGTSWQGQVYFVSSANTAGGATHGESGLHMATIATDPTKLNEWVIVEWDMASAGDWSVSTISRLRFDLGPTTTTDKFEIDWAYVGRYGAPTLGELGFDAALGAVIDPKFAALDVPLLRWDFANSAEGFTGGVSTLVQDATDGTLLWTPTGANPYVTKGIPAADQFKGSVAPRIRARVKRISGTGPWEGTAFYNTAGHSPTASYSKTISAPINPDEWTILEWDMEQLTAGGTDWIDNTITAIRIDLVSSNSPASAWKFDWVAIGKFNAAVSPADVARASTMADWAGLAGVPYDSILTNADSVILGFNASFSDWPTASVRPTGYSGQNPVRETSIKLANRPWSVRFNTVAGGAQAAINRRVMIPALPDGAFIKGALDVYIESKDANAGNTGKPGLMVRIWHATTPSNVYIDVPVTADTSIIGSWQRINFTARGAQGSPIIGIELYMFGAYGGGGFAGSTAIPRFAGNTIFGGVTFDICDASMDGTPGKTALTEVGNKLSKNADDVLNAKIVMAAKGAIQLSDDTNNTTTMAAAGIVSTKAGKVNYSQNATGDVVSRSLTVLGENDEVILTTSKSLAQQVLSNPNLVPNCVGWPDAQGGAGRNRNGDGRFGDGQYFYLPVSPDTRFVGVQSPPMDIPWGSWYTVSFDAYCEGAPRELGVDVVNGIDWDSPGVVVRLTNTLTRYSFIEQAVASANAPKGILRMFTAAAGGSNIVIANVKVELGTKVTPWCDSVVTAANAKNRVFIPNLAALSAYFGNVEIGAGGALRQGASAYNTGEGVYIGADAAGNPVLFVGNANGAHIRWSKTDGLRVYQATQDVFSAWFSGSTGGSYPNNTVGSTGYGYLRAEYSGGKQPMSFKWMLIERSRTGGVKPMQISDTNSQVASFSGSGSNGSAEYEAVCIVTDGNQRAITLGQLINVNHGTPV